jgi:hypothetical protein
MRVVSIAGRQVGGVRLEIGLRDQLLELHQKDQKPAVPAGQLFGVEHHPSHAAAPRNLVVDRGSRRQPLLQPPAAGKANADRAGGGRVGLDLPPDRIRARRSRRSRRFCFQLRHQSACSTVMRRCASLAQPWR